MAMATTLQPGRWLQQVSTSENDAPKEPEGQPEVRY